MSKNLGNMSDFEKLLLIVENPNRSDSCEIIQSIRDDHTKAEAIAKLAKDGLKVPEDDKQDSKEVINMRRSRIIGNLISTIESDRLKGDTAWIVSADSGLNLGETLDAVIEDIQGRKRRKDVIEGFNSRLRLYCETKRVDNPGELRINRFWEVDFRALKKQWSRIGLPSECFDTMFQFEEDDDIVKNFMKELLEFDMLPDYLASNEEVRSADEEFSKQVRDDNSEKKCDSDMSR